MARLRAPAALEKHRRLVQLFQGVMLALVLGALVSAYFLRDSRSYPYDNDGFAAEWRSLPIEFGKAHFKMEVSFPRYLKVDDEKEVAVGFQLDPQSLKPYDISTSLMASGLEVNPRSPIVKDLSTVAGVEFIVSSSTPGVKLFYVKTESRSLQDYGAYEVGPLKIEVYEEQQVLAKIAQISQMLGLPALIVLLVAEWFRRHPKLT